MSIRKTLLKLTVSRASSLSKIFWVWSSGNLSTVVITFAMVYEKNEHRSTIGRSLLPRDTVCWGVLSARNGSHAQGSVMWRRVQGNSSPRLAKSGLLSRRYIHNGTKLYESANALGPLSHEHDTWLLIPLKRLFIAQPIKWCTAQTCALNNQNHKRPRFSFNEITSSISQTRATAWTMNMLSRCFQDMQHISLIKKKIQITFSINTRCFVWEKTWWIKTLHMVACKTRW